MDYSLLLGVHVLDKKIRERGGRGDSKRLGGQKVLYSTARESIQGNTKTPEPVADDDTMGGIPAKNKDEKLLIFLGIIDILQSYRFIKKVEHSWKALVHDGDTVSVHRPNFYADRFLNFMGTTVFKKLHPLRGASSKRKRASFHPMRSASQEVLSTVKEELKEEKKAQSMESLDGQLLSGSNQPDLVTSPKALSQAVSFCTIHSSKEDELEDSDNSDDRRASSATVALDDKDPAPAPPTQGSTPDTLEDYLVGISPQYGQT